jgi:hypothetical protein
MLLSIPVFNEKSLLIYRAEVSIKETGTYQGIYLENRRPEGKQIMKIFANCSTVYVIYFMDKNPRETNKYRPEGGGICWSTPDCRSSFVKNIFNFFFVLYSTLLHLQPLRFHCVPLRLLKIPFKGLRSPILTLKTTTEKPNAPQIYLEKAWYRVDHGENRPVTVDGFMITVFV